MHPVDSLHGFAPFLLFGVVNNQFDWLAFAGCQGRQHFGGFHLQNSLGLPSADIEEVVESAAVGLISAVEMPVEGGNVLSPPGNSHQQD